jgi:hypothetical protein
MVLHSWIFVHNMLFVSAGVLMFQIGDQAKVQSARRVPSFI